jgi:hypothetical protein
VQRAQGVPELSLKPQGRSQTGIVVDRMIEFMQLGCRVDVSSNAAAIWGEARCDEDAIVVHEIVRRMRQSELLIRYGLLRSVPDWNPLLMPLRCVPVPGSKGKPKGIYGKNSNRLVGNLVTYEGDWPDRNSAAKARAHWAEGKAHLRCAEDVVDYARSVYLDWVDALASIAGKLDGASHRLRRFVVHGIGARREPWHVPGCENVS